MKNEKIILCFIYILLGAVLLATDRTTAIVYFTVLPLHFVLLIKAWKSQNVFLLLFYIFLLISIGGNSITFFLTRYNRSFVGTANIGNFDFSLTYFFSIYSYLILLFGAILVFTKHLNKSNTVTPVAKFIKMEISHLSKAKETLPVYPLIFVMLFFAYVSIWMYNQHVGILGILSGRTLPFHMSGILYYLRKLVFPIIVLMIFIKTKNKSLALPFIITYAFIVGLSACSKSIGMMVLIPISLYFLFLGSKKMGVVTLFFTVMNYAYVAGAREIVFATDGQSSLTDIVKTGNEAIGLLISNPESMSFMLNAFFGSFFGIENPVVTYQYTGATFYDLVSFFSGSYIGNIVPDMVYNLYDFDLPEDRAYGICLGISGTTVLLANRSFILILIQALIIAVIISCQNKMMSRIMNSEGNRVFKYVCILLMLYSFYSLITADSLQGFYIATIGMLALVKLKKNRNNYTFRLQELDEKTTSNQRCK